MSEHGSLGLGSPWTRNLFRGPLREEVEALIPAGYRIDVTAYHGSPGPWNLRAVRSDRLDEDGRPVEVMSWPARHDPRTACRVMARELSEMTAPDPSWTEDAAGYAVAPLDWKGDLR